MEPSDRDPGPEDLARYQILRVTRLNADETAGITLSLRAYNRFLKATTTLLAVRCAQQLSNNLYNELLAE